MVTRVTRANVEIAGRTVGSIDRGLLVLLGVAPADTVADAIFLAKKIFELRIFADDAGAMNRSLAETGGALLIVSQFTLFGDVRKGRRPSFVAAASPELGRELYDAFVDAARTMGYGPVRIIISEILPNLFTTLIVFFALQLAGSIVLEASLSFLGAGVQPPNSSWGTMLSDGVTLVTSAPHLTLVPGIMLIVTVLAVNIFGDGLRQAFDPRAQFGKGR